jgi:tryptophan synthase alpha chain
VKAGNPIETAFEACRRGRRKALIPFVTAGDPDLETTLGLLVECAQRGAAVLEVGIPYSDPIADGPVIQASYTRALQRGLRVDQIFAALRELRRQHPDLCYQFPCVAMVSYAIIFRKGLEPFVTAAKSAGFSGLIVPDLPADEAGGLFEVCSRHDMCLVQLVTPTTPPERVHRILARCRGFVYYVSVTGITGERDRLPEELIDQVRWLKCQSSLPVCVGFGISKAEQARAIASVADGVIVGSAIVRRVAELADQGRTTLISSVGQFVGELAAALQDMPPAPS